MSDDEYDPYDLPGGAYVRWLDNLGPDSLWGIVRYEDYPDDTDFSDAYLDPHSEAVGRFVGFCSHLELALYQARSHLDEDMSFARAEWERGPRGCIDDLRGIAEDLPERSRVRLLYREMLGRSGE